MTGHVRHKFETSLENLLWWNIEECFIQCPWSENSDKRGNQLGGHTEGTADEPQHDWCSAVPLHSNLVKNIWPCVDFWECRCDAWVAQKRDLMEKKRNSWDLLESWQTLTAAMAVFQSVRVPEGVNLLEFLVDQAAPLPRNYTSTWGC